MLLLLVEDDRRIASFIVKGLVQAGYAVEHEADGQSGLEGALHGDFDLVIVDLMLPRLDGLSLVARLRADKHHVPVLILSARDAVDDRVRGLQAGGDDYLVKPFAFAELLARVQALLRRACREVEPTTLSAGDLSVDLLRRRVVRGGRLIELQPREYQLLEYFLRNAGRVVSKTMIMNHVWGYSFDPETNVVEARVCRLRDKVDRGFARRRIRTVRGAGYVLETD